MEDGAEAVTTGLAAVSARLRRGGGAAEGAAAAKGLAEELGRVRGQVAAGRALWARRAA
jgi:hypothetical protein